MCDDDDGEINVVEFSMIGNQFLDQQPTIEELNPPKLFKTM